MYKDFAILYDEFINVPYERWANFIDEILKKENAKLVLDLCCGTATLTSLLQSLGYDMIGIDRSEQMLMMARSKYENILFLQQDMRSFELYGTVDAIICTCDALNYILKEEELIKVFGLVKNYLNPNGIFIFDLKTEETFRTLLKKTFYESEKGLITCEVDYDEEYHINEYFLNVFIKLKEGLYERSYENHYQRAHKNIEEIIEKAGFTIIEKRLNYSDAEDDIYRNVYVCRSL